MTGPASSVERVAAADGTPLLVRHWAAVADPWACVLLIHGLAEHSGRWEHVGRHLAGAGMRVDAFDLRGFGASGGRRAWVDRWAVIHDDLAERVLAARAAASGRPLALYGHSLGALIALGYALTDRPRPDRLVLSAPAIAANLPTWQRALIGILGRLAPGTLIPNGFDPTWLASDPAVQAAYGPDPLNFHRTTARFGLLGFGEQDRVVGALSRLDVPTLVIHGGEDRLVPTASSAVFEGRPGVTRRVYEGVRHELHNEPAGPAVLDDVVAWLREEVAAGAGTGRVVRLR